MSSFLQFLSKNEFPFMADVFPNYTYDSNRDSYNLDNALLKPSAPVIKDGDLVYTNLFDAMVDTIYYSMKDMGYSNISILVTATGWPSFGIDIKASIASVENARTYNNNLIKHVLSNEGTPMALAKQPKICTGLMSMQMRCPSHVLSCCHIYCPILIFST